MDSGAVASIAARDGFSAIFLCSFMISLSRRVRTGVSDWSRDLRRAPGAGAGAVEASASSAMRFATSTTACAAESATSTTACEIEATLSATVPWRRARRGVAAAVAEGNAASAAMSASDARRARRTIPLGMLWVDGGRGGVLEAARGGE